MLSEAQRPILERMASAPGWWASYLFNGSACLALLRRGLIEREEYVSPAARRLIFYRITDAGRQALEAEDG